jgi:PAS domain S-box-containing protein
VPERPPEQFAALKAALFDAAPEPLVGVDRDGRIIYWNAAAERAFGYSNIQAAGQPLVELIVPARLRERHLCGFAAAGRTRGERLSSQPLETWARRSDGHEFPVEISVADVTVNDTPAFVAQVRNLTKQGRDGAELEHLIGQAREARAEAENERQRLQEIFATSPYLVLVTEGSTHWVRFCTPSALDVFHAPSDVFGKPLAEAYPEFANLGYVQLFSRVYETGEVLTGREVPLTNRAWAGVTRYFDYTFQPWRDQQGCIVGVIGHGIEVTDKVEARQRLEQALRARDDFVALVSHELRNPLNVLQLQIASTVARLNLPPEPMSASLMRERLAAMDRTMRQLSHEVDRLLEVSRVVKGPLKLELEEFDLGELAQGLIEQMAGETRGCQTSLQQAGDLRVTWDRGRIREVLSNLLSNAYKFGAGKPVAVMLEGSANSVRLEVRDQGPGLPSADQTRIFERFEQAQGRSRHGFGGLGLGLWMCRQIVSAHGGHIWVEGALVGGSRFIAEVPRHPAT